MDFGLAKVLGGVQLTKVGSTVGTAAYMSPEQAVGEEVDHRTDIWSFGVVLYEMISGQLPIRGTYEQAMFYSILNEPPPPFPQVYVSVSPDWQRIVNKCLQKDPTTRYQSLTELLADVTTADRKPSPDSKTSPSTTNVVARLFRQAGRNRKIALAGVGSLALVVVVLALSGRLSLKGLWVFNTIPDEQHLVVLPFTNIGGDASEQPFCDGLVETMTSKLTQLEQFHGSLWVVPASEVRKNKTQSPGEARQSFGANLVVTGNLQLLRDMFRLTLNLIDAKNLRQLNSSVIDIKAENIFALQDQSVTRLLEMLKLELNPQSRGVIQAGTTTVPGAYEFYLQGLGYLQRYEDVPNLDAAISLFEHSIEQDSSYALAYAGLGEAYWRKYEAVRDNQLVKRATEKCEKAYQLNGRLPEVNITLGMVHSGTGKYEEAVKDFLRALDADATSAAAYGGLAKAYEAKDMLNEAEKTYQTAIALKPGYWGGYNDLGVFYFRHSRYEDAIGQFRRVVELTPDNARGLTNLGGIYFMLKRWPDARQMFERSLALKKTYGACSNLGTLYYKEGEYAKAARMYETALDLNDKDYRVWGNLAAAYYWAPGERGKAEKTYWHAIELGEKQKEVNQRDPEVISHLAGYHAMLGERTEALSLIGRAITLAPKDVQVMYRVGAAYEQMGDREKALMCVGQALRNGYPLAEIEHEPELRQLVADTRFQQLKKDGRAESKKEN
jgi:serine/threonine-protein kinase